MLACLYTYRIIEFDEFLRPDRLLKVEVESNGNAGYFSFGRLCALGYIHGLHQAVYAETEGN